MAEILAYALIALGRLALGGYFVATGIRHFMMREAIADSLAGREIANPAAVVLGAAGVQVVAGVLLALGLLVMVPALVLFALTVAVSVTLLNFWEIEEPEARAAAMTGFQQNVAIAGGLLLAAGGVL